MRKFSKSKPKNTGFSKIKLEILKINVFSKTLWDEKNPRLEGLLKYIFDFQSEVFNQKSNVQLQSFAIVLSF